jgi:hypothetical protein
VPNPVPTLIVTADAQAVNPNAKINNFIFMLSVILCLCV